MKFLVDISKGMVIIAALLIVLICGAWGYYGIGTNPYLYGLTGIENPQPYGFFIGIFVGILIAGSIFGPIAALYQIRDILSRQEKLMQRAKETRKDDLEPTFLERLFYKD